MGFLEARFVWQDFGSALRARNDFVCMYANNPAFRPTLFLIGPLQLDLGGNCNNNTNPKYLSLISLIFDLVVTVTLLSLAYMQKVPSAEALRIDSSVSYSEESNLSKFCGPRSYDAAPRITAYPNPSLGSAFAGSLRQSRVRNVGSTIFLLFAGIINEKLLESFFWL